MLHVSGILRSLGAMVKDMLIGRGVMTMILGYGVMGIGVLKFCYMRALGILMFVDFAKVWTG